MSDPGGWKKPAGSGHAVLLRWRTCLGFPCGEICPNMCFFHTGGSCSIQLENVGVKLVGYPGVSQYRCFKFCACDPEGAVQRSKVACEIHIVGTLYGHLLWRNLVNMLAFLGPWPETPLEGEVLKDIGLSFELRSCVKGW